MIPQAGSGLKTGIDYQKQRKERDDAMKEVIAKQMRRKDRSLL